MASVIGRIFADQIPVTRVLREFAEFEATLPRASVTVEHIIHSHSWSLNGSDIFIDALFFGYDLEKL